jgi:hypothetical protein
MTPKRETAGAPLPPARSSSSRFVCGASSRGWTTTTCGLLIASWVHSGNSQQHPGLWTSWSVDFGFPSLDYTLRLPSHRRVDKNNIFTAVPSLSRPHHGPSRTPPLTHRRPSLVHLTPSARPHPARVRHCPPQAKSCRESNPVLGGLRHLVLHVPSSPKCIRGLFTMYATVSQNCTCARPSLRPSHALISPSPVFDRLAVPCCPSPFRPAPPRSSSRAGSPLWERRFLPCPFLR